MSDQPKDRLKKIRDFMSINQTEMGKIVGLSLRGWQQIERGENLPSGQTLTKFAELGISPNWILTGHGRMHVDGSVVTEPGSGKDSATVDDDLHGRTLEAVSNAYKEAGVRISLRNLGSVASAKAKEIAASSDDPAEWPVMIKYMATQLKNELLRPATDFDNSKASA